MEEVQRIASFFRDSLRIPGIVARFAEIRKNPRIPLQNILSSILLMPFWGATSLLALDRFSRKAMVRRLFGCRRKMVVSDTTVARVLNWLDEKAVITALPSLVECLDRLGFLKRRLSDWGSSTDRSWELTIT